MTGRLEKDFLGAQAALADACASGAGDTVALTVRRDTLAVIACFELIEERDNKIAAAKREERERCVLIVRQRATELEFEGNMEQDDNCAAHLFGRAGAVSDVCKGTGGGRWTH